MPFFRQEMKKYEREQKKMEKNSALNLKQIILLSLNALFYLKRNLLGQTERGPSRNLDAFIFYVVKKIF